MKLFALLLLLDINNKLDQLIEAKGEIMLNLENLKTSVADLTREVGETFTAVNKALDEIKAKLPDPSDQAVIDNITAMVNAQVASLDAFQAQLSEPTSPLPEPPAEPTPE